MTNRCLCLAAAASLLACGAGSSRTVGVDVEPPTATVEPLRSAAFSAVVTGTINTAVTWAVQEGSAGGSVTSTGLYTASAMPGTYHVVAACQADPSKTGSSTVTVASAAQALTVSPNPASVPVNGTQQFTVSPAVAVDWRVAPSSYAFPLKVEAGGRYLVDQNGLPFRIHGDAAWSAIANLTSAEQDTYLGDRAVKGFNTVLVNLFERKFSAKAPNLRDGTAPFTTAGNLSTINQAYLDFAGAFVDKAAAQGIAVMLDVMYLGYGGSGSSEGFYDAVASSSAANMTTLGTAIGNTFKARRNVVFVLGGDYTLTGAGTDATVADRLKTLQAAVKATGATQPWSAHWGPGSTSSSVSAFANLIDLRGGYDNTSISGAGTISRAAYNDATVKPAYFLEGEYENEHSITRQGLREELWRAYLGAIGGALLGSNPTWHFNAASASGFATSTANPYDTWQHALGASGSLDYQRMGVLLDSVAWFRLRPEGLNGVGTVRSSGGTAAAVTPEKDLALVYVASTGTGAQSVTLDLTTLTGDARARWWNPATGALTDAAPATVTGGSGTQAWTTPGNNGTGTNDWLLVMEGAAHTGGACGKITAGGLYTAPASVPQPPVCYVTAAQQSAPTSTGRATVNVLP